MRGAMDSVDKKNNKFAFATWQKYLLWVIAARYNLIPSKYIFKSVAEAAFYTPYNANLDSHVSRILFKYEWDRSTYAFINILYIR